MWWISALWASRALPQEEELSGIRSHLQSVDEILLNENISVRRTFNVMEKVSLHGAVICALEEMHLQAGTLRCCKAERQLPKHGPAGAVQLMSCSFCSWFPSYTGLAEGEHLFLSLVCKPGVTSVGGWV